MIIHYEMTYHVGTKKVYDGWWPLWIDTSEALKMLVTEPDEMHRWKEKLEDFNWDLEEFIECNSEELESYYRDAIEYMYKDVADYEFWLEMKEIHNEPNFL